MKNWKTIEREPLCKLINSYKICGFPPPTSGGIGLLQIISILNNKKSSTNFEPNLLSDFKELRHDDFFFKDKIKECINIIDKNYDSICRDQTKHVLRVMRFYQLLEDVKNAIK